MLTLAEIDAIEIGTWIRFRAVTRHSDRPAWRKVTGFSPCGRPTVKYHGWDHFIVRHDEILEIGVANREC